MITKCKLDELFNYSDGALLRKSGKVVGTPEGKGYLRVRVAGKDYKVHRLIYLMHHGYIPDYVDHIDGDKTNNRIENLRPATAAQNNWNVKRSKRNTSGVKGVNLHKATGLWEVRLWVNGVRKHLGYFKTIEEAENAIHQARSELHGAFAKHE